MSQIRQAPVATISQVLAAATLCVLLSACLEATTERDPPDASGGGGDAIGGGRSTAGSGGGGGAAGGAGGGHAAAGGGGTVADGGGAEADGGEAPIDGGAIDAGLPGETCDRAKLVPNVIPTDGGFTATFRVSAVGDDLALGCATDGGAEAVYQFELTDVMDIRGSASAPTGTVVNFSVREGDCASGPELACSSGDANGQPAFILPRRAAGTFFLVVELEAGTFADVTLRVARPLPPAPNDTCATATPLQFVNDQAIMSGYTMGATNGTSPSDSSPSCVLV